MIINKHVYRQVNMLYSSTETLHCTKEGTLTQQKYYFIIPETCEKIKKKSLPGCCWYKEEFIKINCNNRICTEHYIHFHRL